MNFRNRYNKITAALLIAALLLPASMTATAEGQPETISAKGTITSPTRINLLAPMGGQLKDFSWKAGDRAEAGQVAAEVLPVEIDAANDGVITGLNAQVGDQAEAVQAQYEALCHVERQDIWHVKASTSSAYNKPRNRDVRVGESLRVYKSGDEKEGQGTVISVDGKNLVLEMKKSDFELEDDVKLYLGVGSDYKNTDLVGKGEIARPDALAVTGTGIVASVLVKDGDTVVRGQPLFLMDVSSARYGQAGSPQALFPEASLIEQVLVTPGQMVAQGQALMTLIPEGALEATLEVDELDIAQMQVGQRVRLKIDAHPDDERAGAVLEIRPIGNTELDTTKYDVRVSIDQTDGLLLGMHVTGHPGQ
jgi:multidrug efflux pump subunit AcrA (membrane-fusion protein)